MKVGNYKIEVNVHGMPQKVASAFERLFGENSSEKLIGAGYEFISYLGSKVVNGTNHALLAKQTLIYKNDVTSIVLLILNEKPGDMTGETISIVEIQTLISNGGSLGGLAIAPITNIPDEAQNIFNRHFGGYFGANNKTFALLATQVVRGACYVFAVESTMQATSSGYTKGPKSIQIVKLYSDFSDIETMDVISEGNPEGGLGYAFTWLSSSGNNNNAAPSWP